MALVTRRARSVVAVIAALVLGVAVGRWSAQPRSNAVPPAAKANAPSVLRAEGHGYAVSTEMEDRAVASAELSPPWGVECSGDLRPPPATFRMVSALRMRRGSAEVSVPRSVFCDLADVDQVSVRSAPGGCVVHLTGGDAATSWEASIVIRGEQVTRREVHHGEFPEDVYEQTQYHYDPPDT